MTAVGILGGGQLARMLIMAGAPLGLRFVVVDPTADACAGQLAPLRVGEYRDEALLAELAAEVDVVTFDFENVPAASALWLGSNEQVDVFPNAGALATAQDRLSEKSLFRKLDIPVPEFADICGLDDLKAAVVQMGTPCILKTRRLGYDGKGQFRIRHPQDVEAAWQALGGQVGQVGLILEGFVPFQREVSVVGVRARDGEFRAWPLTENWHVDGVLSASLAPATVPLETAELAYSYAKRLADYLGYVGTFALELFYCEGQLLANEMAPRVHNSGHWTIEGAEISQFENHLRAVTGLPLGATRMRGHACMLNWIGTMPDPATVLEATGGHWHDYGKEPRAGRKVGHATIREDSPQALIQSLLKVADGLDRHVQIGPVVDALRRDYGL